MVRERVLENGTQGRDFSKKNTHKSRIAILLRKNANKDLLFQFNCKPLPKVLTLDDDLPIAAKKD